MLVFSRRLKDLRKKAGLTQAQLGDMVGVTKVSISCYENGSRIPTLDTIIDLADALNTNLSFLLGTDYFIVSEDDECASINLAKSEIELIKELRVHIDLYTKLLDDPKRCIELIEKKLR